MIWLAKMTKVAKVAPVTRVARVARVAKVKRVAKVTKVAKVAKVTWVAKALTQRPRVRSRTQGIMARSMLQNRTRKEHAKAAAANDIGAKCGMNM